ncbi:MAG: 50S ribosomal protein L25 [Candidatus Marinimicrobia bacterium]|nr:50S ribosomal protein L25 [Candidatus Neomarinimicrobiota bacterium]MDP6991328.1 50S ribosomal protein L25 [Candidatus Neomarinimicrobiota bacterium]
MASYYKLPIEDRSGIGSGSARAMRRNGKIPTNYYYHGEANQNLAIDKKAFYHAIHSGQKVFELEMNGETIYAMIKAAQYNPVTEEVIHVDLMRVRRDEKMTFSIPVVLEGEAVGASEGGLVTHVTTAIDLECYPTDVPESVTIDISGLELHSAMTAVEIALPDDATLISAEDTTIVTCNPPKAEVEPEPEEIEVEDGEVEDGEATKGDGDKDKGGDEGESSEES